MKGIEQVADLMTREVVSVLRNDKLSKADRAMREARLRHLPVLDEDGGHVVGVISRRDIYRPALARMLGYGEHGQDRLFEQLLVKDVMTNDVVGIAPDARIEEAARTMRERQVGSLMVLDGERLVGILTEADFVAAFARG